MNWFKMFLVTLVLAAVGFTAVLATDFNDKIVPRAVACDLPDAQENGLGFIEACLNNWGFPELCLQVCYEFCEEQYEFTSYCSIPGYHRAECSIGCMNGYSDWFD